MSRHLRTDYWHGERNRPLSAFTPCTCGCDTATRPIAGYITASNAQGRGFTMYVYDREDLEYLAGVLGLTITSAGGPVKRLSLAELVKLTDHVAPYVKDGKLRKSRRLADAMTVLKMYQRGEQLLNERDRLVRLADA